MKYQKQVDKLRSGGYSRADMVKLKSNAERLLNSGDIDAKAVLDEINIATPSDKYILFMGFCPGADFSDRQDIAWKENNVCRFDYLESDVQVDRFNTICPGDLVILKKREVFGKTMKLFGHGRVKSIAYDDDNIRYLVMDWSDQENVIEVPLMGCNSTVDIKSMESVLDEMPEMFWQWLNGTSSKNSPSD